MAVDINFGGMNLSVPEGGNTDGLMSVSHNMIYEDGALRPVYTGEKVAEIDTDRLYVHDNGYRHYISFLQKTSTTYTVTAYDENFEVITTFEGEYTRPESVVMVGNTVIISANEKMYYFLWRAEKSTYVFLGNEVPRVSMAFGLQGELLAKGYKSTTINFTGGSRDQSTLKVMGIFSLNKGGQQKTGLTFTKGTNYAFYATTDMLNVVTIRGTNSAGTNKKLFTSSLRGILYRLTWVCDDDYTDITYEINHTVNQNLYIEEGSTLTVDTTIVVDETNYTKVMAIMNGYVNNYCTEKNKFIYPFFVRYAVKMYSGDYLYMSAPVLMIPNSGYAPMVTYGQNKATDEVFAYAFVTDLQYSIIEGVTDDWADIISGVDIFVSQPLYCYNQGQEFNEGLDTLFTYGMYDHTNSDQTKWVDTVTGQSKGYLRAYFGDNNISYDKYVCADLAQTIMDRTSLTKFYVVKPVPIENIEEKICNTGNFYHFKTIEFADLKESGEEEISGNYHTRKMITIEPTEGTLSNLVTRRAMTDDVLSNRTVVRGKLHAYNNRLHVYDATVRLPIPTPIQNQVAFQSNTALGKYIKGVYVYIHTEEGNKVVEYKVDGTASAFDCVTTQGGLCWFFYPDNQAYQVEFYITANAFQTNTYYKTTLPLKQHELLNGAYWYAGEMDNQSILGDGEASTENQPPTVMDTIAKPHTVYVSDVNNPWLFASKNVVSIGCSEIYKLSSAARALSSGQFGQFPLYAFCDNGIWAMETSSEGAYVARQPITRDVCNNIESVTQIDSGVVFATARGIMCLYGSEVTCLSDALVERSMEALDLPRQDVIANNVTCGTDALTEHIPFVDFIMSCYMAYDYTNKRLILLDGQTLFYGYVYSFASGCWATMNTDKLSRPINSYPDAMCIGYYWKNTETGSERKTCIYNMSKQRFSGSIGSYAITRPLNLGSNGYKTINELAVRGAFDRGDVRLLLYGTNDGRRWHVVSSSKTYKLQGYSGSPYKRFALVVMADLEYADYITGQTIDYMNRLNDKLR